VLHFNLEARRERMLELRSSERGDEHVVRFALVAVSVDFEMQTVPENLAVFDAVVSPAVLSVVTEKDNPLTAVRRMVVVALKVVVEDALRNNPRRMSPAEQT
jgi:hypothetical protein